MRRVVDTFSPDERELMDATAPELYALEDIQKPEGWGFRDDSPDFSNGCLEMMELEREMMDATAPELYAHEDIQKPEGWGFLEGHDLGVHPEGGDLGMRGDNWLQWEDS